MVVLFGMPKRVIASGTVLSSGADGQGAVTFEYDGMEATVLYSKIADSSLPTEIQGEDGTLALNRINKIERVTYTQRKTNVAGGKGDNPEPENITMPTIKDEYYYEVAEFIDLVLSGKRESAINSHGNSLTAIKLVDEIRRQLGVVFPADEA